MCLVPKKIDLTTHFLQLAVLTAHNALDPQWFVDAEEELMKSSSKSEAERLYHAIAMVYRNCILAANKKNTDISTLGRSVIQGLKKKKIVWIFNTAVFGWDGTVRYDELAERVVKVIYSHFANHQISAKRVDQCRDTGIKLQLARLSQSIVTCRKDHGIYVLNLLEKVNEMLLASSDPEIRQLAQQRRVFETLASGIDNLSNRQGNVEEARESKGSGNLGGFSPGQVQALIQMAEREKAVQAAQVSNGTSMSAMDVDVNAEPQEELEEVPSA